MILNAPNAVQLQDKEDDRHDRERDQGDDRPFLHFALERFGLIVAEERFAGTAQRVDSRGVARLEQNHNHREHRADKHQKQ